jgi:hypothetical protein
MFFALLCYQFPNTFMNGCFYLTRLVCGQELITILSSIVNIVGERGGGGGGPMGPSYGAMTLDFEKS